MTTLPAGERVLDRRGLMRVELVDAARAKRRDEPRIERRGHRRVLGRHGREPPHGGHVRIVIPRRVALDRRARGIRQSTAEARLSPSPATIRERAACSDASLSSFGSGIEGSECSLGPSGSDDMTKLTDASRRRGGDQGAKRRSRGCLTGVPYGGAGRGCGTGVPYGVRGRGCDHRASRRAPLAYIATMPLRPDEADEVRDDLEARSSGRPRPRRGPACSDGADGMSRQ